MDIHETKEIITVWIRSCVTAEQLSILKDAINDCWMKRFEVEIKKKNITQEQLKYEAVLDELYGTLTDQGLIIVARSVSPAEEVPTLALQG